MKTLKSITEESRKFYTENAGSYFSKSFTKKMGGTQTITFEDDFLPAIELDKREFYTGRGAKYNSNSMHEHIDVFVTKKEFDSKVKIRATEIFTYEKTQAEAKKALKNFCKENDLNIKNYSAFYNGTAFFEDDKKSEIENELNIDLTDFFNASGKTYFFAETKLGILMFYHNHRQSYSYEVVSEEKRQEFADDRESWVNAPYASEVGQTENENLYVC